MPEATIPATDMVSSSMAHRNPPWIIPAGLVNSGLAVNSASSSIFA